MNFSVTVRLGRQLLMIAGLLAGSAGLGFVHAGEGADVEMGKKVFTKKAEPTCATCHALKDAGATGAIGPDFDKLQPDADRVYAAVTSGVGVMPAYKGSLSEAQMQAVAAYVAQASGGAK